MSVAEPRPAATVVLARPSEARFDVFLVRRHDHIAFMGGAHVFPGGRVDPGDEADDASAWCDGVDRAIARMPARDARQAVAFSLAAVRELFEEAGVLLARDGGGIVPIHAGARARFDAYRRDVSAGALALRDLAAREQLRVALDALALFAHWVTPDVETRRFDTYFFLAMAPAAQDATHDDGETTDGIWIDPADALERCLRGDIALPPPTWTTLRALEACASVDDAWRWAESQRVPCVLPRVRERADGTREILLPGDPDYPGIAGFEAEETRFLLLDGRWQPVAEDGA